MASYKIVIKPSASKDLENVAHKKVRQQVVERILQLAGEPRPRGCLKLTNREAYRIRQGDYRILYEIDDYNFLVTIVAIGHRRDVYR